MLMGLVLVVVMMVMVRVMRLMGMTIRPGRWPRLLLLHQVVLRRRLLVVVLLVGRRRGRRAGTVTGRGAGRALLARGGRLFAGGHR